MEHRFTAINNVTLPHESAAVVVVLYHLESPGNKLATYHQESPW